MELDGLEGLGADPLAAGTLDDDVPVARRAMDEQDLLLRIDDPVVRHLRGVEDARLLDAD